jgi:hypothetical protein
MPKGQQNAYEYVKIIALFESIGYLLMVNTDLFKLATRIIPSLAKEKTDTIPILLVAEFPWHPHYHTYDPT